MEPRYCGERRRWPTGGAAAVSDDGRRAGLLRATAYGHVEGERWSRTLVLDGGGESRGTADKEAVVTVAKDRNNVERRRRGKAVAVPGGRLPASLVAGSIVLQCSTLTGHFNYCYSASNRR